MSAVATSFFAGFSLSDRTEPLTVFTWIGFGAAALLVTLIAWILYPRNGWTFGHNPDVLIREFYLGEFPDSDGPLSIEECHRYLAEDIWGWISRNKTQLRGMYRVFEAAVVVVGVLVLAWLGDLIAVNS